MNQEDTIRYGPRGEMFTSFLKEVFKKGNIKEKYAGCLLSPESVKLFERAFTHESADNLDNYQFLEILGDITVNKIIVWWFSRRFPKLNNPMGVEILARFKIAYGARKTLFIIGQKMGMWPFITISKEKITEMQKTIEDTLEAFMGAIEKILDERFMVGVGYNIVYDILSYYLDQLDIDLSYEALYDPRTRVEQILQYYNSIERNPFPNRRAKYFKLASKDTNNENITQVKISFADIRLPNGQYTTFSTYGSAYTKKEAVSTAMEKAYSQLHKLGLKRPLTEAWKQVQNLYPEHVKK